MSEQEQGQTNLVTKVSISVGRTINMGNFESLRIEETYDVTVHVGADLVATKNELRDFVENQVANDAVVLAKRIKERARGMLK